MISRRHVLTAARCIWDSTRRDHQVGSITFSPGRNGDVRPYEVLGFELVRTPASHLMIGSIIP